MDRFLCPLTLLLLLAPGLSVAQLTVVDDIGDQLVDISPATYRRGEMYEILQQQRTAAGQAGDTTLRQAVRYNLSLWHTRHRDSFPQALDSALAYRTRWVDNLSEWRSPAIARAERCRLADVYFRFDSLAAAEAYLLELRRRQSGDFPDEMSVCDVRLVDVYLVADDPLRIRRELDRLTAYFGRPRDTIYPEVLLSTLEAMVYYGEPESFLRLSDLALREFDHDHDQYLEIWLPGTYSQRADHFARVGDYDRALDNYQRAYDLRCATGRPDQARVYEGGMADAYRRRGEHQKALHHYENFMPFAQEAGFGEIDPLVAGYAATLRALGHFARADSVNLARIAGISESHERQLNQVRQEITDKYEAERRDETIAAQRSLINLQRRNQYFVAALAVLLLLVAIGTLFALRNNRRKNGLLSERNAENELLLREIHHRVKNNLETISSLLELQSASLDDERAQAAVLAGQARVHSIGLLHQKLYQGRNRASINLKEYFADLVIHLRSTYSANHVHIIEDVPPTHHDVETAVPLGLILNEWLTNAFKYAFPDGEAGTVRITWRQKGGRQILRVSDDGVGKAENVFPRGTGFGSQLVGLLARQLGGRVEESVSEQGGLVVELSFGDTRTAA